MNKRNIKRLRYLDSKGALHSNGIEYGKGEKYWKTNYSPNYSLVENCTQLQNLLNREEQQYHILMKELNMLQKQKDLLQWHICNNVKKLSMKKSEKKIKEESRSKLDIKLKSLKERTRIYKFEHDILEEEVNKMEKEFEKKIDRKNNIEIKFNEWINKKEEYLRDITQERVSAFRERKKRQIQLRKLLLIMKQEDNKNYNMEFLHKCENNLMNEICNYKKYKTYETKIAMDLISAHPVNNIDAP
ncbi:conserved Plasmodium protein, unknown function [Plasmodium ovale wallikeri]|uniref:Uncharacterized protein n=2 Tax=Plasmodium ovale TaxID=36330 RepID=A0A1A8YKS7_PLAOA|nr:conserved Plasmodium protein, unknown function [Plasmodium ovale wallikeri]SBT32130.1 conserved Plasmodium protein, unknown function [Plasmodium ovale wallikeri]SBT75641.1 conserved Plasmodium protein, unknown function [Plasmodium ovale]